MSYKRQNRIDKKSRTRGRIVSFVVHLLLLLGAFLPFLAFQAPAEPSKESLVIQFDYPYNEYVAPEKFIKPIPVESEEMGSKMSGSEAGGNESTSEPMQSRPQQAAPSALASPAMPALTKTTTSSALRSSLGEIPMPTPKISQPQKWQTVSEYSYFESDGVEELRIVDWSAGGFGDIPGTGEGDGDDDSDVFSDGFGSGPGGQGGQGTGTGSTTGSGSGPGGGTGTGSAGDKTGVGQNGNGLEWGVGLDGFLNRKFLKRANVGRLAVNPGKIAIVICVDRNGKVISAKYDLASSTLKEPSFVVKAEACALEYVFAPNPAAPERECGKMSFIFKID